MPALMGTSQSTVRGIPCMQESSFLSSEACLETEDTKR